MNPFITKYRDTILVVCAILVVLIVGYKFLAKPSKGASPFSSLNPFGKSDAEKQNEFKVTINSHLKANVNAFQGDLKIKDFSKTEDNIYIVKGTFNYNGTFNDVTKPYVAHIKPNDDKWEVIDLCYYYNYKVLLSSELKCTSGAQSIEPLPAKKSN